MKFKEMLCLSILGAATLSWDAVASEDAVGEEPLHVSRLRIRDPFIVVDEPNQRYLLIATAGRDGVQAYSSDDLVNWRPEGKIATQGQGFAGEGVFWAPEVHAVNGKWYLYVTVTLRGETEHPRTSIILRSDDLLGAYVDFGRRPKPPLNERTLDGTYWKDDEGQNWLVYCQQHIQVDDGRIRAVRMTKDMAATVGEPVQLFDASEGPWVRPVSPGHFITDGCFLYRTEGGQLLMIWSSFNHGMEESWNYCIGIARSESGRMEGPWTHDPEPLFDENGGHGMIFTGLDGKTYLTFHAPNRPSGSERLQIRELIEKDGGLGFADAPE